MQNGLSELLEAVEDFKDQITSEQEHDLDLVFTWLAKYIKTVYQDKTYDKNAQEMRLPLDATFNIAIKLFSSIDRGDYGLDDKLAEDLKKLKVKYLGL